LVSLHRRWPRRDLLALTETMTWKSDLSQFHLCKDMDMAFWRP
jgi:hypothetical protein